MDASSGAAGGAAASGKRFEVKKWNAVRRQAALSMPSRPAPRCVFVCRSLRGDCPKPTPAQRVPLPAIVLGGMPAPLVRRTEDACPHVGRARAPGTTCCEALPFAVPPFSRDFCRSAAAEGPRGGQDGAHGCDINYGALVVTCQRQRGLPSTRQGGSDISLCCARLRCGRGTS